MKELLKDLVEQMGKQRLRYNELKFKWDEYIFVDEFVAEVLYNEYLRIGQEMKKTAKAIQECRLNMSMKELKEYREERQRA